MAKTARRKERNLFIVTSFISAMGNVVDGLRMRSSVAIDA
jgi:hypothetical protein